MIRPMEEASILILMDPGMKVSGEMTSNMEWGLRDGQMEHSMRDSILMERNTERANSCGPIKALTMENLKTIIYRVLASTSGPTVASTTGSGSTTKCRVTVHLPGPTVVSTLVSTSTI